MPHHHIVTAALGKFAKAANQSLANSEQALQLADASLNESRITALFTVDPSVSAKGSRSLLTLEVISGSAAEVESAIEAQVAANPYIRPLRVFSQEKQEKPAAASKKKTKGDAKQDEPNPEDPAAEGKQAGDVVAPEPAAAAAAAKSVVTVIAILGTYQP